MIPDIDRELIDWIQLTLGSIHIFLDAPSSPEKEGISLYLFDLVYRPAASSVPRLPLEISLKYLITAWAKTPAEAHQQLGKLIFSALECPDFEINDAPLPLSLWTAFGIAPRPAFTLSVPLQQARPYSRAPLVRTAPIVQASPTQTLEGILFGPEEVPIAGASVFLPALHRRTRTDRYGKFSFDCVPAQPTVKQIQVQAKGRSYSVHLDSAAERSDLLDIHLQDL